MIFRRERFGDLVRRQLDLFESDEAELLDEAAEADTAWTKAAADETEELYGDYQLVVDAVGERLYERPRGVRGHARRRRGRRLPECVRPGRAQALQESRELPPGRRGRVKELTQ